MNKNLVPVVAVTNLKSFILQIIRQSCPVDTGVTPAINGFFYSDSIRN
jgi:hypothetical protein